MKRVVGLVIGISTALIALEPASHPLKILMVADKFPVTTRPFINNQVHFLSARGHEIAFITRNRTPEYERIVPGDTSTFTCEIYRTDLPEDKQGYFDIICYQFGDVANRNLDLLQALTLNGKSIVIFRGADVSSYVKGKETYAHLLDTINFCLPCCESFRRILLDLGCDPVKTGVVHSTINCDNFPYREPTKPKDIIRIITTARLVEKKGLHYSIEAVAELIKKGYLLEYWIVGWGPLKQTIEQQIIDLGMQEHIKLLGVVPNQQLANVLHECHIFVLAAIVAKNGNIDGIPNALKEAMACGLPVISTNVSGIPELVEDGISGFLVEQKNVAQLIEKLEYLITHPEKWNVMGYAGREKVLREHHWTTENYKLEDCFYRLLGIPT